MPAKVLIVEDEILIGLETEATIQDLGHISVGIAATAAEALALAERERPDIALVDVNLADGATGPTVAAELAGRGVAVVFVTANPRVVEASAGIAVGVLDKPAGEAELGGVLAFLTEQAPQPPARLRVFRA